MSHTDIPAPVGYALAKRMPFDDIATNNTFVSAGIHYRKVSEYSAHRMSSAAFVTPFEREQQVIQTLPLPPASEISEERELRFEPCEMIRLTILPGIGHTAEIVSYQGNEQWRVNAKINGGQFEFIVFEHQIVKAASYVVTGVLYRGECEDGAAAIEPVVESYTGFTPDEAMNKMREMNRAVFVLSAVEYKAVTTAYYFDNGTLRQFVF
jgi:hypothetical protein